MAENLLNILPIELCHNINLLNLYKHNYKLVLNDLVNKYWNVWVNKKKYTTNLYYYCLYNSQCNNILFGEYDYFNILLRDRKYNHRIYDNALYHPIYKKIYKKKIKKYYYFDEFSPCYPDKFLTHL